MRPLRIALPDRELQISKTWLLLRIHHTDLIETTDGEKTQNFLKLAIAIQTCFNIQMYTFHEIRE